MVGHRSRSGCSRWRAVSTVFALAIATTGVTHGSTSAASRAPEPGSVTRSASPAPAVGGSAQTVHADFNGDGYSDMAAGADLKSVSGQPEAGAVSVIFGGPAGLTADGNQFITQDSPGVLDQAESGDEFGRYMGGGDFNGDGFYDLAVGVPNEDVDGPSGPIADAGAVEILYGSAAGLSTDGNQFWTQLGLTPADTAEAGDWFGGRMQGGDFNGDGYEDLAASSYFEDIQKPSGTQVNSAGAVDVLYGSPTGLTSVGVQFWTQDSPDVLETSDAGDLFGRAMGSGDLNGDGFADLAISARGEQVSGQSQAGAIAVLYGSAAGLTADGNQLWTQDSPGILDEAERSDWLGRTGVTAGDFNGDGYDDLAAGALQDSVGTIAQAGVVNVIYGSAAGLTADGNQLFTEDTPGSVADGAEQGDRFGRTVEAADFNGDGFIDLAIGISNEGVNGHPQAGAAVIVFGSAAGLTEDGNQFWTQDSPGILEQADSQDSFDGRVPDVGDLNADGFADIAIGVFKEDIVGLAGPIPDAGAVNVIYGSAGGLTSVGNQFWTLNSPGMPGNAEARDAYGQSNVG